MIVEESFPTLNVQIALNNAPKSVAFIRDPRLPFLLDNIERNLVIWSKDSLKIGEKEYPYSSWHILDEGNQLLYNYIQHVIETCRVQQFGMF